MIGGAKYLLELLGAERCVIAVESNKLDAIEALRERLPLRGRDTGAAPEGKVSPGYGAAAGVHRHWGGAGAGTDAAGGRSGGGGRIRSRRSVSRSEEGLPLLDRVVTVAGSVVERPQNLRVPSNGVQRAAEGLQRLRGSAAGASGGRLHDGAGAGAAGSAGDGGDQRAAGPRVEGNGGARPTRCASGAAGAYSPVPCG